LDAPDEELGRRVSEAASGNPFFTAELVMALIEEGVLVPRRGLSRETDLARIEPPRSLAELLGRRLAGVGRDARAALEALAILGRPAHLELVAPTAGLGSERTLDALDELIRRQLALQRPPEDGEEGRGPTYGVVHAHIQRAALRGLGEVERRAMNRRAAPAPAETAEREAGARGDDTVERLARHFFEAGDDDRALEASLKAGARAARANRHDDAIAHYERALESIRRGGARDAAARVAAEREAPRPLPQAPPAPGPHAE